MHNNPFRYKDPNGQYAFVISLIWEFGSAAATFIAPSLGALFGSAVGFGLGWFAYELTKEDDNKYNQNELEEEQDKPKKAEPKFNGKDLGNDPTKCPGEGFEWKGKGGPETGKGSWVKGEGKGKEIIYPDLNHPPPKGPHWDYNGPDCPQGARLFPDGTWEFKV